MCTFMNIKYSKILLWAASCAVIDGYVVKSRNDIVSDETQNELLQNILKDIENNSWEDVILIQEKDIVHLYLPQRDTGGKREILQTLERPPYAYLKNLVNEGKIILHKIEE